MLYEVITVHLSKPFHKLFQILLVVDQKVIFKGIVEHCAGHPHTFGFVPSAHLLGRPPGFKVKP